MVSSLSAGCCYYGRNHWDCLKKSLIRFPAALIRTTCVYSLFLAPVDAHRGLFLSLWLRFTFHLGSCCFWVSLWSLSVCYSRFFIYFFIIYCVSFVSTLQMRSQTGNVRSLFPTGATGMIILLHQRQILFYKSLSKRLSTLHSNGTSLPATLVRGAVIHSVSVPSHVVKRCCDFFGSSQTWLLR